MKKKSSSVVETASVIDPRSPLTGLNRRAIGVINLMSQNVDWDQVAQDDLRDAIYNEAGHATICNHFGLSWRLSQLEMLTATLMLKGAVAQIIHDRSTPFRNAVIGWAGVVAESLRENPDMDEYEILDLYDYYLNPDELSPSDHGLISETPYRIRALTTATGILRRRWADVDKIATSFLEQHRLGLVNKG